MNGRIRYPDTKNAASILEAAVHDMNYTRTLAITQEAAVTVIRNVYESFRMLGDALLIARGAPAADHIEAIQALIRLRAATTRPVQLLDNLRRLRHNINYYGYRPGVAEAEDAVSLAQACFPPMSEKIRKIVEKK